MCGFSNRCSSFQHLFFQHLFVQLTNVGTNLLERGELRYELPIAEERVEELAEGEVLEGANRPRPFRYRS